MWPELRTVESHVSVSVQGESEVIGQEPSLAVVPVLTRHFIVWSPIVVMPQSWTDETNTKLVMNPSFAYVLPTGREKLIKLGFEGSPYVREWDDHEGDNSFGLQAYVKVGIGMFTAPNYWGIYYDAALDDGSGWQSYNQALVPDLDRE